MLINFSIVCLSVGNLASVLYPIERDRWREKNKKTDPATGLYSKYVSNIPGS